MCTGGGKRCSPVKMSPPQSSESCTVDIGMSAAGEAQQLSDASPKSEITDKSETTDAAFPCDLFAGMNIQSHTSTSSRAGKLELCACVCIFYLSFPGAQTKKNEGGGEKKQYVYRLKSRANRAAGFKYMQR